MVDSNIAMMGKGLDTATPIRQMQQDDNANALNAEQVLKAHYDNLGEREKQRLQSTIVGAAQLKTYLDKGDVEGAHSFLMQRQQSIHQRMANGENVDDQETAYALDKLRRGDLEGLKNDVNAMAAAGQAYGMIGGQGTPSSVQEWQYFNSLPKDQQSQYLTMKRANQVANLGGTTQIVGPDGKPVANLEHTLKPEDKPTNAFNKAEATAQGTVSGENTANAQNTIGKMGGLMTALGNLKTSSVKAPSGVVEALGAQVANKSGLGSSSADAAGDFQVKRAAAENEIRAAFRVAGSGSQSDADAKPFIDMLPVADDADSVKASKVAAAMQAVRSKVSNLAQSRGLTDPFSDGAPSQDGGGAPVPGAIKVSDGKTIEWVMPANLPQAQAEGFQPVQ